MPDKFDPWVPHGGKKNELQQVLTYTHKLFHFKHYKSVKNIQVTCVKGVH